ncbi:ribonuclease HII [Erysipelothrix urinaevulpis]|uniref:ribonuclease HII n=1 Tax=Erysipelothrix urinaevulpis TaxID=2683717 RepID=UPI001F19E49C|nr:ribonuclease HII [Erysipelothrix urinaevulpis]
MIEFESIAWENNELLVGIDEAGRGPMAGPCVVCGVVFPQGYLNPEINDSKKLSERKRQDLVDVIYNDALNVELIVVDVETIDEKNIYQATKDAMIAIAKKSIAKVVVTDAMPFQLSEKDVQSVVKADQKSISVAAASIIAKTTRDQLMVEYDRKYPAYGFAKHKGYGTKQHKEAIIKFGRCPIHRTSFRFKDEHQISLDI